MKKIAINDMLIDAENFKSEVKENIPTGNKLLRIEFNTMVLGESQKIKFEENLKRISQIRIDDDDIKIKAIGRVKASSYRDMQDKEKIIYSYSIEVEELDKDLPEEWSYFTASHEANVMNWIRMRALSSLLIEKGIITFEEYENKIKELNQKDFEGLSNYILYGKLPTNR